MRVGGSRRKTRNKLKKTIRKKGKISLRAFFSKFNEGDKVKLVAEPAVQTGQYFRRFHGKLATVLKEHGACYLVQISDRGKVKNLVVHPVHLQKI